MFYVHMLHVDEPVLRVPRLGGLCARPTSSLSLSVPASIGA